MLMENDKFNYFDFYMRLFVENNICNGFPYDIHYNMMFFLYLFKNVYIFL